MTNGASTMQTRFAKPAELIETPLPDELILLDPSSGEMYSLNRTAQFVWERLGSSSPDDIAAQLVEAFEITPECAEADVRALLADLAKAGLIETLHEVDP